MLRQNSIGRSSWSNAIRSTRSAGSPRRWSRSVGLVGGQEDRLERLAGPRRTAAVVVHQRVVEADPREVDRLETRKPRGRQVTRLDDEWVGSREPEPTKGDDLRSDRDAQRLGDDLARRFLPELEHPGAGLQAVALDLAAERVEPADRVLDAGDRHECPEPSPDLEQALSDQADQRLADRRPAHAVLRHHLRLRRDLGARLERPAPDPIAQVGLDPPIEGQTRRRHVRQPLIPVMAIPRTKWRWATTKRTIIGMTLTRRRPSAAATSRRTAPGRATARRSA